MNYLFIIFVLEMNMYHSFFYLYPKIKISKILKCNNDYGTEYDLEMDKEEYLFHSLNFNYSNANTSTHHK